MNKQELIEKVLKAQRKANYSKKQLENMDKDMLYDILEEIELR